MKQTQDTKTEQSIKPELGCNSNHYHLIRPKISGVVEG
jgi:hypothetical protein